MASLTSYADIVNLILPDLPGVEAPVASFYLRRAGRKFCQDAEVYVVEATATLEEDEDTYSLALENFEVRRIKSVRFLDPATDVAKDYWKGRTIAPAEYELTYDDVEGDQITFTTAAVPTSAEDGFTMVAEVVYVPVTSEDVLPENFINRYADAIRYRAMYELLVLPGRPWTSELLAQEYYDRYLGEVARGVFERDRKHKAVDLRMQAPSFL